MPQKTNGKQKPTLSRDQRQARTLQVIFTVVAILLIVSMVISMVATTW